MRHLFPRAYRAPQYSAARFLFHSTRLTSISTSISRSAMKDITLEKLNIPVKIPDDLSERDLLSFPPFNNWINTLTRSLSLQHTSPSHAFHADPYALRSITVQSFDTFGSSPARLGFLKLRADLRNSAGETLPGSVFLRGPSVAMLVLLVPDDVPQGQGQEEGEGRGYGERYVVLTVQPRVPAGSLAFVELPAGMVDGGTFAGTAAQEMREELGLEIPAEQLTCLSDMVDVTPASASAESAGDGNGEGRGGESEGDENLPVALYPSAGGCDEHIAIYMHERRVPRETLKEWTGKLTGLRDQGEKITLKLVPLRDLWKEGVRDAKCLAALAMWEGLRREGKL